MATTGTSSADGARAAALGAELVAVHDGLRAELGRLRAAVVAGGGPERGRTLGAHCLAFCRALTAHHTGEDEHVFPALERRHPELAGVLAQLREDHHLVAGLLAGVETAVARLPADPGEADRERFLGEVDGIGAILESHFRFEERRIVAALDAWTGAPGPVAALLGVPAPPG